MKKLAFLFIIIFCNSVLYAQKHTHWVNGQQIICGAGSYQVEGFIPPPKSFGAGRFERQEANATFEIEYENFPENAQNSVQYAVDIWASLLKSAVPIRVKAVWDSSNLGENSLGGGRATTFQLDFDGALQSDTWYVTALAEKLSRKEINDSEKFDIEITFNANADWYYETDGNTPQNSYDLVTTALHEIGHGLGIASFSQVNDNIGTWGKGTQIPAIYDRFLMDENEAILTENTPNTSELYAQKLTENNLFFKSQLSKNQFNIFPKLHAPEIYTEGSSISHLDLNSYPIGSENSLMIPEISKGIAVHHPGDVIWNMLADMGWITTFLDNQSTENQENSLSGYMLEVDITSDTDFDKNSVVLYYSSDNFFNTKTVKMTSENGQKFTGKIPFGTDISVFQYYFTVSDPIRSYRFPSSSDNFTLNIINDNEPPIIQHQPINSVSLNTNTIPILAQISDISELSKVELEYFINDEKQANLTLNLQENGAFLAEISTSQLVENDTIKYKILATDNSSNKNASQFPEDDYLTLVIESERTAVASYQSDFDGRPDDFIGTGFSIRSASGFSSPAIHSEHPYETEKEYFFQLKTPIIIQKERIFMQFDEVVLVEMGSPDSKFGDENFWDFVAVEGSNDNGKTWQFLTEPYDSRAHENWVTEYENFTDDTGESFAEGNANLFQQKTINQQNIFSEGEEVLIRFRLVSDAEVTAWGWTIDNLSIQTEITSIEDKLAIKNTNLRVYPNPTSGRFQVNYNFTKKSENIQIDVIDIFGRKVYSKSIKNQTGKLVQTLDLLNVPKGVYFVNLITENQIIRHKLIKK